jgi:hypothetical protein
MPHPWFTLLIALLLAVAMAAGEQRPWRGRFAVGVRTLMGCAAAVVAGGWLMRWIHG